MALNLTLPNPSKSNGMYIDSYTVILECNIDEHAKEAHYVARSYPTQADRENVHVFPFHQESHHVRGEEFMEYFSNSKLMPLNVTPRKQAYTHIKRSILNKDGEETNPWYFATDV